MKLKSIEEAKAKVAAFNKKARALRKQENALTEALEALGNELLDMVDNMDHVYTDDEKVEIEEDE